MPVLFGSHLFGPSELFGWSQTVGKLAGILPEPNAKLVFGTALFIVSMLSVTLAA